MHAKDTVWMRGIMARRVPKTHRQELHGAEVCKHSICSEDRECARSDDAEDGEGAEVDSALPRREHLGLLLDLDLERDELVVPSKDSVVLCRRREGGWSCSSTFSSHWAAGGSSSKTHRAWVSDFN